MQPPVVVVEKVSAFKLTVDFCLTVWYTYGYIQNGVMFYGEEDNF